MAKELILHEDSYLSEEYLNNGECQRNMTLQCMSYWASEDPEASEEQLREIHSKQVDEILQLIFQKSITTGQVPSHWKKANMCPIFKKGERYDPANY